MTECPKCQLEDPTHCNEKVCPLQRPPVLTQEQIEKITQIQLACYVFGPPSGGIRPVCMTCGAMTLDNETALCTRKGCQTRILGEM